MYPPDFLEFCPHSLSIAGIRRSMPMNQAFELGGKLLRDVNRPGQADLDVARLHSLHQRGIVVRPPHRFDHGTAIDAGELGNIKSLVPAMRVSKQGHLQSVAGAMKEPAAGTGKVTRIGPHYVRHAFMHRVLNQITAVTAAKPTDKTTRTSIPGAGIGDKLQVSRCRKGLNMNGCGSTVLIDPSLPALRTTERFVGCLIERAMNSQRLGISHQGRKKKRKRQKRSFQDHNFIFNEKIQRILARSQKLRSSCNFGRTRIRENGILWKIPPCNGELPQGIPYRRREWPSGTSQLSACRTEHRDERLSLLLLKLVNVGDQFL